MVNKEELHEMVAELRVALQISLRRQLALRRENRRLTRALRDEAMHFERLSSYVATLRDWAAAQPQLRQETETETVADEH